MREGSRDPTFMHDQGRSEEEPSLAERLHEVVDEMLAPYGKQSPRGLGLLADHSPPFDISKPNQHDSKAEFSMERAAVETASNLVNELLSVLQGPTCKAKHRDRAGTRDPIPGSRFSSELFSS